MTKSVVLLPVGTLGSLHMFYKQAANKELSGSRETSKVTLAHANRDLVQRTGCYVGVGALGK